MAELGGFFNGFIYIWVQWQEFSRVDVQKGWTWIWSLLSPLKIVEVWSGASVVSKGPFYRWGKYRRCPWTGNLFLLMKHEPHLTVHLELERF